MQTPSAADLPPNNPSYRIVNMVREKISTQYVRASDTQVARAIGVSRAAISAYKSGRDSMSSSTLAAANQLLKLGRAELADLAMDLRIEMALNDTEREMWVRIKQLLCTTGRSVASILLVCLGLITAPEKASAADVVLSCVGNSQIDALYIMRTSISATLELTHGGYGPLGT